MSLFCGNPVKQQILITCVNDRGMQNILLPLCSGGETAVPSLLKTIRLESSMSAKSESKTTQERCMPSASDTVSLMNSNPTSPLGPTGKNFNI